MSIKITGLKNVQNLLTKLVNPAKFFDDTVFRASVKVFNDLKNTTPFNKESPFAHTKNMWENPQKLADSVYTIDNAKTTASHLAVQPPQDDIYNLATILNDGRGAIRPKKIGGLLFIPLTRKAIQWYAVHGKTGKVFPKTWVFGRDYVFAKRARAYPGTKFIDIAETKGVGTIEKAMLKKLKDTFK